MAYALPMFPLGSVLLPHAFLPLQVFEPRYKVLTFDCLQGDREFGVVLIERGFEVGGGDERFAVGTVARIVQAEEVEQRGIFLLATVGTRRIRVRQWLDDDPYPRAEVEDLDEPAYDPALHGNALATAEESVRRALALKARLGEPAPPPDIELASADDVRAWQLCSAAPIGSLDRLRLLEADDPGARLTALARLVDEESQVLEFRLQP